jgi:hypothetical protein
MFTTLPLELFVCREVRAGFDVLITPCTAALQDFWQVIEQYFFEHEEFDHHRHIIITTVILFASMIRELSLRPVAIYIYLSQCSLASNVRPWGHARNNRGYAIDHSSAAPHSDNCYARCICYRAGLHISRALLHQTEQGYTLESEK